MHRSLQRVLAWLAGRGLLGGWGHSSLFSKCSSGDKYSTFYSCLVLLASDLVGDHLGIRVPGCALHSVLALIPAQLQSVYVPT